MTAVAKQNQWTFRTHHDGTFDEYRVTVSSDDREAAFDADGRLVKYTIYATAAKVEGMAFKATRYTAVIQREFDGRIAQYVAFEDFGPGATVTAQTKSDLQDAVGSAVLREVVDGVNRSRLDADERVRVERILAAR